MLVLIDKFFYKPVIVKAALFLEAYIFPLLYSHYAIKKAFQVYIHQPVAHAIFGKIISGKADINGFVFFGFFTSELVLFFMNFVIAWGLIVSRKLLDKPRGFREIVIPILALFFCMLFNILHYFPNYLNFSVIPSHSANKFYLLGAVISIAGWMISALALYSLRHSMAAFVEVRDIVTKGPYRYVRHPVYLGYIIGIFGLCLINGYSLYWCAALVYINLQIYRARLEEKKILSFFPAYANYMKTTPFLIPRFKIFGKAK